MKKTNFNKVIISFLIVFFNLFFINKTLVASGLVWIHNPTNNHDYAVTEMMSWDDAELLAQDFGGHLVTINDSEENTWLLNTFGDYTEDPRYWIGLNDKDQEGSWVWSSGETPIFQDWCLNEPNDCCTDEEGEEDAAVMNDVCDGWNDLPDGHHHYAIIEVVIGIPLCTEAIIIDSFPAPDNFGYSLHGIAFDGQNLWAACHGGGLIHEMGFDDDESMIILDSIDAPTSCPTGITFVGKNLFVGTDEFVDDDEHLKISKIKTTGEKAGKILKSFDAPGEDCVGLAKANGRLYNSDFVWSEYGGAIHTIQMSGKPDATFFFPEFDCPEGLTFDGEFIWLAEWCQNRIYKLNADDLTPICYFEGPGLNPIGLTFADGFLWLADQGTRTFYKIDIGSTQGNNN
jgi:Lectin C-type domain